VICSVRAHGVSHTGVSALWFIDYLRRFSEQLRLISVLCTLLVLWNLLDLLDYDTVALYYEIC